MFGLRVKCAVDYGHSLSSYKWKRIHIIFESGVCSMLQQNSKTTFIIYALAFVEIQFRHWSSSVGANHMIGRCTYLGFSVVSWGRKYMRSVKNDKTTAGIQSLCAV